MKYKNRLIVPTLVSTSLIASAMVANAEEVDQDTQYSNPETAEYATSEETSETELDMVESEEVSGESSEEASDETDAETAEEEVTEETETAQAEEVVENELDESNVEEVTEEPTEPVEESAEAPVEETQTEEAAATETAEPVEEVTEEPAVTEVVEEQAETPVEEIETEETAVKEEPVEETQTTEAVAEEPAGETTEQEVVEEPVEVEEAPVEPEEAPQVETVEEEPAVEEEVAEPEVQSTGGEQESEAVETETTAVDTEEVTEEPASTETESAQEEPADAEEPEVEETEPQETTQTQESTEQEPAAETQTESPQSEEPVTYKYNSDNLDEELADLSAEEQAAFLEENADNIEADEELLTELTHSLAAENEEINADEIFTASTMSTMSLSQAITDVNQYIADNNFEVADIQYDYIQDLPKLAYGSDYGWEPENGEVGKPSGVVLHDVGNENSTIYGEIEYMTRNWENAFVHAFVDADNIIQVADTDYLAYGAGPVSNDMHMHVELMRYDNKHDFAKSINNYADYIANLLYKYKLPVVSAEETGEGTLYSHVAVSNHLGGTASPDPYEYFARYDYEYNDVISLIGQRYNDMYNKVTTPQISMPINEGETNLVAEVNENNLGLYESVTDVRTKNADSLLGQQFRVVRTATYNYDQYYLLEDENGVALGWMYAGDLTTAEYVPEDTDKETETPQEPEEDTSDDNEPTPEQDESVDDTEEQEETPEQDTDDDTEEVSDDENLEQDEPAEPETPEEPAESDADDTEETDSDDNDESTTPEEDDDSEDTSTEAVDADADDDAEESSDSESDDADDNADEPEQEASDDNSEDTETESDDNEEPAEADVDTDGEVSSSVEDAATGIRVVSESGELDGKSLAVTTLNPSNAIGAAHDLYDIHVLDENGSLYNLQGEVTVYLPANGYVSNVYYLGDIGETLEAVDFRVEDGYVVFNVNSFSQYAVVYGVQNEDNTTLPVLTADSGNGSDGGDSSADKTNEHQKVYTEQDVDTAETAEQPESSASTETAPAASNDNVQNTADEVEEQEVLPDTGTPAQNTTIFAAILAALGLGFLVKRRKTTEK
ncbi:Bifunctional autolysin precursor [Jeotgalicoccus saudimassiliensis]|uniref:Bifunctional autolysin n=1 Tax=Jeotgalicoccus saudimassiliensis TaxID=1461582 RepID=A0A078M7D7_9STAP|nr:GW dipeptide domain-containing protein [Jeotgalicoccus saudimassiliensis]CEA00606.1 Bifunctional autolysin precursor [Jeotgalicoccus saudimassiliensis]